MNKAVLKTNIPCFEVKRGKVRDVYDLGNGRLLIVATDRISAFDRVLPNGIPDKGVILTQMSNFWFDLMQEIVPNHLIATNAEDIIEQVPALFPYWGREQLEGRTILVRKAYRFDVECIVRGFITGSAWKDYQKTGTVCGLSLPKGLAESEKFAENLFTPSTKAETGHDENVDFDCMASLVSEDNAEKIREASLAIYAKALEYASDHGILIADTKFEFGLLPNGSLVLIDEVLTPDSSRFWPAQGYEPGRPQPSYDKQFLRDHLKLTGWGGDDPAPELPPHIVEGTARRYAEIRQLLLP